METEQDPLYDQAVELVVRTRRPSIALVQRHLRIGYSRAALLIESMERAGLISQMQSNGNREVLVPARVDEKPDGLEGELDAVGQPAQPRTQYASFESWYAEFKAVAGRTNPQLAESDGKSLLDFMDQEPLQRAFRDGVSLGTIAVPFAKSFDARTFGRR